MTTTYISTVAAKEEFSDLVNRVIHHQERIILTRRGKDVAAIVPIEDLLLLLQSQRQTDLEEAVEALKEARRQGTITLKELQDEIG